MQPNLPLYTMGREAVRALIRRAPWMQLVSYAEGQLAASPTPVLLAPDDGGGDSEPLILETHLGRADARAHGLLQPPADGAAHRMLAIAAGEHGYISPSWYVGDDRGQVPTWNFEQATLDCSVEVLDARANLETLQRLVAHFEKAYGHGEGVRLDIDDEANQGLAMGTVGLRLTVRSLHAKAKMSQYKSAATQASVLAQLDASRPRLARRMREVTMGTEPPSVPPGR